MSEIPKFKAIKIKLDNNHTLDINSKGVLLISTCTKQTKNIGIKKLNQSINSLITEPKKRGPKKKQIEPIINELIEQSETEQPPPPPTEPEPDPTPTPTPIKIYKKRGPKSRVKQEIGQSIIKRKVGRPKSLEILNS